MRWVFARCRSLRTRIEGPASRLRDDERGVTFIVTALASAVLLGFAGLAVDVASWKVQQRNMQGVVDQAALGAATAYRNANETGALGDSTTAQNAAYATAIQSGFPASAVTVAAFNNGGTCTNDGCLQVTLTQDQPRYFTGIFSSSTVPVTVSAVGTCVNCGNGSYSAKSGGGDACVMALDAAGSGVITASGTPVLSLSNCNLYNNSPNTSATVLNGGALIEGCTTTNACGSQAFLAQPDTPSGAIDIPITTNASPAADPLAGLTAPTVGSCISSFPANPVPSGTYCPGNLNNQSVTFADNAVIVITGGLSLKGNSQLSGNNATLFVQGGASINANSTMSISAPTSGPYAGVAIWFDGTSAVTYDGNNNSSFSGAIYAPKTTVTWGGTNQNGAHCARLIAGAINLHGTPLGSFDNSQCPGLAGPTLTASGSSGTTPYSGSPMLVQ